MSVIAAAADPSGIALREYRVGTAGWRTYTGPVPVRDGVTTMSVRATDVWGNRSAALTFTVRRDTGRPTVSAAKHSTVRLTAADAVSGVQLIQYRVDRDRTWRAYRTPVPVSGRGWHTVTYRALDRAGNVSTSRTMTVRIR